MIKKTTLTNGLRIITIPQRGTRAVTVLLLVGTGSKYETKRISGVSHFLEHMYFKGTKKRPTVRDVLEPLDRIGGIYNAFTGGDYTGYFAKVEVDHLGLALDWVSDIFLHSLLSQKEIQKEKSVVMEEINMHRDIPMSRVDVLWSRLLYGDQPAGWDIAGTKESVLRLSRRDLSEYMKSQYAPTNTIVCVAGNVRVRYVEEKIQRVFGGMEKRSFQAKPEVIERQTMPEATVEWRETDQTHIALGVRGYNLFHPLRYAQELLATMLGGMMSSRLMIEVRERLALAYSISTGSESNPETGYIVTTAGIKNDGTEKAIQTILREYKAMKTKPISSRELQKAKDHEKGRLALTLESSDARTYFYGMQELLEGKILTVGDIYDTIDKVRGAHIKQVAQDIFRQEKLNLVVLGPYKEKMKFTRLLML